uniref:shieldin complex subunit 2 n=1 Tax=Scatophagus argus TaxID=75038 RepID=UPI001ED83690|nr:shieldin complex subunit 2 [Scatophagus argus]XP_046257346.1 shieldin complex subunit 2 [Scatophagus argus]XP_046257347.1 shieldin complex subunit 2 [Scatophagus argus]XP_046257348.1 shieldin complex subunit 2 [Scatophagus argus]
MCERPKIHIFLGAPPFSGPAGVKGEEHPPGDWRHLELTWQDGHLRPATENDRTSREKTEADVSLQSQDDETNADQDDSSSTAERTTEASRGLEERAGSGCDKDLSSAGQRHAEGFLSRVGESDGEEDGQCSASVHEYLDSCFPAVQTEPERPEHPGCSGHQPSAAAHPLSARTQYLTTWALSQALLLRGKRGIQSATSPEKTPPPHTHTSPPISSSTPELFSPGTPSPGGSAELFSQPSPTPRVEEGGVVMEATADGVLCSQEAQQQESTAAQASSSKSPELKKARISENLRTEAPVVQLVSTDAAAKLRAPTTLLSRCDKRGVRYSVLVAVVHPCHLKEVKVKSGMTAGNFIPLASIVVTDQSGVEMKVVLWRRAAFWTLTVGPGDILLITGLQVNEDRWRGETVLQSTFSSKLLNLGQITASTSPPAPQHVNARSLSSLCGFLRERSPLLVSLSLRPPQELNRLPYATLRSLRVNTLVHALLRVTHTHISSGWRSEADSRCRSAVQLKAVLTVEQPNGQQGTLVLWGAAVDWRPRFSRDRAAVWDFHVLLVREGLTRDLPELHSTPWSSVQPLDPASLRAQDFLRSRTFETGNHSSLELDLDTLLSQKYSGEVELRVQINSFHFQDSLPSQNAPQPVLDSSTPLDGILTVLSGDITYVGCSRCSAELDTDANGIYGPCYPCLPHTAVRHYYRPGVLTVSGRGSSQVCIQVPPVPLQQILEAPPDKLHRSSAPGSEVKHIQVAAERIQELLSLPRKVFIITIRSHFLRDENSIPIDQDFTLLDFQLPS